MSVCRNMNFRKERERERGQPDWLHKSLLVFFFFFFYSERLYYQISQWLNDCFNDDQRKVSNFHIANSKWRNGLCFNFYTLRCNKHFINVSRIVRKRAIIMRFYMRSPKAARRHDSRSIIVFRSDSIRQTLFTARKYLQFWRNEPSNRIYYRSNHVLKYYLIGVSYISVLTPCSLLLDLFKQIIVYKFCARQAISAGTRHNQHWKWRVPSEHSDQPLHQSLLCT